MHRSPSSPNSDLQLRIVTPYSLRRWWALATCIVVLSSSGCGAAGIHRRNLGRAVDAHMEPLGTVDMVEHVRLPAGVAWNSAVAALQQESGVASADPERMRIETAWTYGEPVQDGRVNIQTRARHVVSMTGDPRLGMRPRTQVVLERREREVCGSQAGSWQPGGHGQLTDPEPVVLGALERRVRREAAQAELVFPMDATSLAAAAARATTTYRFTVEGTTATSDWRVTRYERRGVVVEVRSQIRASASLAGDGASRLAVSTTVQHRRVTEDEGESTWETVDEAERVSNGLLAGLVGLVRPNPVTPREEERVAFVEPPVPEPELPAPSDPLQGRYALYVRLASAPRLKFDGTPWDAGGILGQVVRLAPVAIEAGRAIGGDASAYADLGRRLTGNRSARQRLIDEAANRVGNYLASTEAPDLQLVLTLGASSAGTSIVNNTYSARWDAYPHELHLNGEQLLGWHLWDLDLRNHDSIAASIISLREIADACGVHCQQVSGAVLCFELVHQ